MKHRIMAWVTLCGLALTALFPASAEGVYLCVGDDGHVALSDADCGPCCIPDAHPGASEPRPALTAPPPACPPCVDVPLGGSVTARVAMAAGGNQPPLVPFMAVSFTDTTAPPADECSTTCLPEARGSALPMVRTTVLLI